MGLKEQLLQKCHNSVYFFDLFKKLKDSYKILITILFVFAALVYAVLFIVHLIFISPHKDRIRNERLRLFSVLEEKYFEESIYPNNY